MHGCVLADFNLLHESYKFGWSAKKNELSGIEILT